MYYFNHLSNLQPLQLHDVSSSLRYNCNHSLMTPTKSAIKEFTYYLLLVHLVVKSCLLLMHLTTNVSTNTN